MMITIALTEQEAMRYRQLKGKRTWKRCLEAGLGMQQPRTVTMEAVEVVPHRYDPHLRDGERVLDRFVVRPYRVPGLLGQLSRSLRSRSWFDTVPAADLDKASGRLA